MTTIPEKAVKAAIDAFHLAWNNNQGLDNELPAYAHRAALTAAIPFLPVQGAVKKLEWKYVERAVMTYVTSDDRGMLYYINQSFGSDSYYFATVRYSDGTVLYDGDDMPSAKAAAQADYEARILSALEPAETATDAHGWLFNNPDTGIEWSEQHPIESGEVPDAENVRPASAEEVVTLLREAWNAFVTERAAREKAEAQLVEARKALGDAADALDRALEDVEHWGAYAGEYFQDKHDLDGDLSRISEQATAARSALEGGGE